MIPVMALFSSAQEVTIRKEAYPGIDTDRKIRFKYSQKPQGSKPPCFQHFVGNCTAGCACTYSHDPVVLAEYAQQELQRLVSSTYITVEDLVQAAREKEAAKPQQTSDDTADNSAKPTAKQPADVRAFMRPKLVTVAQASTDCY